MSLPGLRYLPGLRRLWPRKLLAQMVLLVVLALLLAQGISTWLLNNIYQSALVDNSERHLVWQFASVVSLLEQTPAEIHPRIISTWRRPGLHYGLAEQPPEFVSKPQPALFQARRLQKRVLQQLGPEYEGRLSVFLDVDDEALQKLRRSERSRREEGGRRSPHSSLPVTEMLLVARLNDDRWLWLQIAAPEVAPLALRYSLPFVVLASVLVLLAVVWQLRKITRPLSSLARAANDLGRGREVAPLPVSGPVDVRETVAAFNHMNERLQRFVSERTRLLAALSHDLRTPLTSMRLRLELMAPGEQRDRLLQSLDEMQQMTEATLAFVRESGDLEPTRAVDMSALLDSLCEDLRDLGMTVTCAETPSVVTAVRPVSMKRALRNVIENAVHYGGEAQVALRQTASALIVTVQDAGPGIPEGKLETVFEPFVRVEESRSRDTGGMGLGLSIARQIITGHGGEIVLRNTHPGLRVEIRLPR